MVDPLVIAQQVAPPRPVWDPGAMRRVSDTPIGGYGTVGSLAMDPANPNFRSRIPRPPCEACQEDHVPGQEYDHLYLSPEEKFARDAAAAAPAEAVLILPPMPPGVRVELPVHKRVAIYNGRQDNQFVVCVEEAPDWDVADDASWKLDIAIAAPVIDVLRKLDMKISDKTGGDFLASRQEFEERRNSRGKTEEG